MRQHLTVGFDEIDLVIECSECSSEIVIVTPRPGCIVETSVYDDTLGVRCPHCNANTLAIQTPGMRAISRFAELIADLEKHAEDEKRAATLLIRVPLEWAGPTIAHTDHEPSA